MFYKKQLNYALFLLIFIFNKYAPIKIAVEAHKTTYIIVNEISVPKKEIEQSILFFILLTTSAGYSNADIFVKTPFKQWFLTIDVP